MLTSVLDRPEELEVSESSGGSGNSVDVSLDGDAKVSRGTQAVVIYEPVKRQFLLQTSNGSSLIYLNDELLMTYAQLKTYDKITLGEAQLLFVPFCCDKFAWDM